MWEHSWTGADGAGLLSREGWWVSNGSGASEDAEKDRMRGDASAPSCHIPGAVLSLDPHKAPTPGLGLQVLSRALGPASSVFSYCLSLGPYISRIPLNSGLCRSTTELGSDCLLLTPRDITDDWVVSSSFSFPIYSGYRKFLNCTDVCAQKQY